MEGVLDSARRCLSQTLFMQAAGQARVFEIEGHSYALTVASTRLEREEAYQLVHKVYKAQGFADPESEGLWYSIHNALPGTVTFLVRNEAGEPIASGTVVPDSPFGLPMERMYGHEISELRDAGRRMCEINSLVSTVAGEGWNGRMIILKIFSAAFAYIKDVLNADDLVCVTSPEHAKFYSHVMMFDSIGDLRTDPHANGAASLALRLDVTTAEEKFREKYGHRQAMKNLFRFFRPSDSDVKQFRAWLLDSVSRLDVETFSHFFLERADLVSDLKQDQIEYLMSAYPEFPILRTDEIPAGQLQFAVA